MAGAVARRSHEDVVHAIAVRVAGVGHREAVVVARGAVEAVEQASRAARVDVGGAAVGERFAHDRILDVIAVDVAELAHGPAEVRSRARRAVELL